MPALTQMEHLGGLPLVAPKAAEPTGWQFRVKYAFDRVVAGLAIVLLSPILIAAALAVLVSMGRPVFFRQLRIGRDGRPFEMLKFRSMAGVQETKPVAPEATSAPVGWKERTAGRASEAPSCGRRRSTSCRSCSTSSAGT